MDKNTKQLLSRALKNKIAQMKDEIKKMEKKLISMKGDRK